MVALAVTGENKLVRYKQQDVDAVYIAGQKIYGRNLWSPLNKAFASDYNTVTTTLVEKGRYKVTITGDKAGFTNAKNVNAYMGGLLPAGYTYSTTKTYSASFKIKFPYDVSAIIYIYVGSYSYPVGTGSNSIKMTVQCKANEWTDIVVSGFTPESTATTSLVGFAYVKSQNPQVPNYIGLEIEFKDIKLEEGELSPYSIHSSLL